MIEIFNYNKEVLRQMIMPFDCTASFLIDKKLTSFLQRCQQLHNTAV